MSCFYFQKLISIPPVSHHLQSPQLEVNFGFLCIHVAFSPSCAHHISDSFNKDELIEEWVGVKFCTPVYKDKDRRCWLGNR